MKRDMTSGKAQNSRLLSRRLPRDDADAEERLNILVVVFDIILAR